MPTEIERKFLPKDANWRPSGKPDRIVQGFFWLHENATAHIDQGRRRAFSIVLRPKQAAEWRFKLTAEDGAELLMLCPGYLTPKWTFRVRHSKKEGGFLTLKGPTSDDGLSRPEYEYPLKPKDTRLLLGLCADTHISKDRYCLPYRGRVWEVDIYHGDLGQQGLVTCEVELPSATAKVVLPPWVGREVTQTKGFSNAALARSRTVPKLED
jgi:CYTH domain-containing protein